jgi:electron transfer flavoprotein alpha subunit
MAILLIAEHDNAALSTQTAKALTAAKDRRRPVDVLVAGKGRRRRRGSRQARRRAKVLHAEDAALEHQRWPNRWRRSSCR